MADRQQGVLRAFAGVDEGALPARAGRALTSFNEPSALPYFNRPSALPYFNRPSAFMASCTFGRAAMRSI